ncbi:LCP family protein [Paenibacillus abyssi]|uniref:Cell envelope-related transcriptional attenuator domain-containing protein n=1 Tax=Paenibacillus abyssi TaxID=1340531 RepID=A0A917FWS7_9BACL|nr:LCP family protein [Paenibacillus abyssi]GGG10424.1 hypothetical protein GCM10010916_29110 [Paenibacillus abyssi]
MVFILIVLLAVAGYLGYLVLKTKDTFQMIGNENAVEVPEEQSAKNKPVTVLLLGMDSRANGGGLNTDVIKIAALNPNSKTSTIVSVPRDSKIELDGYRSHKANAYYAIFYSQAIGEKMSKDEANAHARRETREMFSQYFGIPIDYTVVVNFNALTDTVNALGGIDVNVDMDMRYVDSADGTDINLKAGQQKLDGKNALDYVRYRKSKPGEGQTKESSDFERNKRQTQVIGAIVDKMTSLGGVTRMGNVIDAVGANMKTDIHPKEIETMLTTYFGMKSSSIESIPLDGEWRSPYVQLDGAKLDEARNALKAKLAD